MPKSLPRRVFLQQLAAMGLPLAAATTTLARPLAAASPFAPKPQEGGFRKALGLGMIQIENGTLLDRFALAAELGYEGIEMNAPNDFSIAEVVEAKQATGLEVHGVVDSVHWGKPFSSADAKVRKEAHQGLEQALHDAHAYGADGVLLVPAVVNGETSYTQAWKRSIAGIKPLLPLAKELQININIENVWNGFLLSPLEMAQYIDAFESPMVGAYLDPGNLVRFGWPTHWVEALGSRIRKMHVKGYSRKLMNESGPWSGFGCGIHDGDCDWPDVVKGLHEVGYSGWFTAEVGGGGKEHLQGIAQDLDRLMKGK